MKKKIDYEILGAEALVAKDYKNLKEIKGCLDTLNKVINEKNATNIGITGGYGVGKTTFLNTFVHYYIEKIGNIKNLFSSKKINEIEELLKSDKIEDHKKLEKIDKLNPIWKIINFFRCKPKPVRISLATLNSSNSKTQEESQKSLFSIEEIILKQLFYSKKITDLPNSRFKKIRNLRKIDISYLAGSTLVLGIIYILLNVPLRSKWKYFLLKSDYLTFDSIIINYFFNINLFKINLLALTIIGFAFIISAYILLREGLLVFNSIKDSIKYKNGGIEISSKEGSPLDQYLDEVIYFFEKTKSEIVILEDLDRVGDIEIFIKLKNINNKLNKCEAIKQKVTFIYVMKDSLFETAMERSKFFDYILPIVPQVNSFNSETVLKERLSSDISKEKDKISERFIEDVSIYIQDMRLLKTICNDYASYRSRLGENIVNLEKFFSMMIYKNIFYKDFELLQFDKGGLFKILKNKNNYIEKEIENNNNEIVIYEEKIKKSKKEIVRNVKELRKLIAYELSKAISGKQVKLRGTLVTFDELIKNDNFQVLTEQTNIEFYNSGHYSSRLSFKDLEDRAGFKYEERLESITNQEKLNLFNKNIKKLEKKNMELKNLSLKEVLKKLESDFIFEEIEKLETLNLEEYEKQLLVYLLKNGCLDEGYHMYISIFREGSYTKKELMFLQNIRVGRTEEFNYKFNNLKALMKRLRAEDFFTSGILNYEIFGELIVGTRVFNSENYKVYLNNFLKRFEEVGEIEYKFLEGFFQNRGMKKQTLPLFFKTWKDVCGDLEMLDIDENFKKEWLSRLISYARPEKIKEEVEKPYLKRFIDEIGSEFFMLNTSINNLISVISACDLTFKNLDVPEEKDELFNYLYKNHNYSLTFENVKIIGERTYELPVLELLESNYSTLKRTLEENDPLWIRLNKNKNEYIENVLLEGSGELKDKKEDVIELLKDAEIEIKLKKEILKREILTYDFSEIPDNLWKGMIALGKVKHSWKNVKDYLDVYEYQDIRDWVEDKLSELKDIDEFTEETLESIILCEQTSPKSLEKILAKLEDKIEFEKFPFESAEEKLLAVAIKANCFVFNSNNFESLKKMNLLIKFIRQNFDIFIEYIYEYPMEFDEVINVLDSGEFTSGEKGRYISAALLDLSDDDLSVRVTDIVKENSYKIDLSEEDKRVLFYKYKTSEDKVDFLFENLPEESKELLEWMHSLDEVEIKKSMISFKVETHRLEELFKLLKERKILTKQNKNKSTEDIIVFNRTRS